MKTLVVLLTILATAAAQSPNTRIIGGRSTTIEEYPHQVSIQDFEEHFCGGSIVKATHIVTAAHCLIRKAAISTQVRVGTVQRIHGGTLHAIKEFKINPDFNINKFDCDVAIIILKDPIIFSSVASPISLATQRPKHGDILTCMGWGAREFNSPLSADLLNVVNVTMVENAECARIYAKFILKLTNNMICATSYGKGTYQGDSGSALINEKKQLVGIVSWGNSYNPTGYPGVFTDVMSPAVRKFIVTQMT